MPTYSGNLTVVSNGAAGTGAGSWSTPTLASSHSVIGAGQTTRVALLTLGGSIVIPANEVVVGIDVALVTSSSAGTARYNLVQPIKGGVQAGNDLSASTAWGNATFGGSTQLWGETWAITDFDTNMGFAVQGLYVTVGGTLTITSGVVTVYTILPSDFEKMRYIGTQGVRVL